jgi:hypothetical protein
MGEACRHYIQGLKQMNDRKSNNDAYNYQVIKRHGIYEFIGDRYDSITAKPIFLQDF